MVKTATRYEDLTHDNISILLRERPFRQLEATQTSAAAKQAEKADAWTTGVPEAQHTWRWADEEQQVTQGQE